MLNVPKDNNKHRIPRIWGIWMIFFLLFLGHMIEKR